MEVRPVLNSCISSRGLGSFLTVSLRLLRKKTYDYCSISMGDEPKFLWSRWLGVTVEDEFNLTVKKKRFDPNHGKVDPIKTLVAPEKWSQPRAERETTCEEKNKQVRDSQSVAQLDSKLQVCNCAAQTARNNYYCQKPLVTSRMGRSLERTLSFPLLTLNIGSFSMMGWWGGYSLTYWNKVQQVQEKCWTIDQLKTLRSPIFTEESFKIWRILNTVWWIC